MELLIELRQMMADQRFFEVQQKIEVQTHFKIEAQYELLSIYYESLKSQKKIIPPELLIALAEAEVVEKKFAPASKILKELSPLDNAKFYNRILKVKIDLADLNGQIEDLYNLLTEFVINQFEQKKYSIPDWVSARIENYFKNDFNLKLRILAISLMLKDFDSAEKTTSELILNCYEKSSPKKIAERLLLIVEVLNIGHKTGSLEIYKNYCSIAVTGIQEKLDYKRIIEMIIYFEKFQFQILVLNLLNQIKTSEIILDYVDTIKKNPDYSYVYLDKYFSHLKTYFYQRIKEEVSSQKEDAKINFDLEKTLIQEILIPENDSELPEDDTIYANILKYQTFNQAQLCDLAISFYQLRMVTVSVKAATLAQEKAISDEDFLKATFLKLTGLLELKDYRAALDTCFIALEKSRTENDFLSFLYCQAEIYIRLKENKSAAQTLSKVLAIDSSYRLAKERLEKLNEI